MPLPNLSRAQASAEAGYASGTSRFPALAELIMVRLDLRLELAAARRDRDAALADLAALVATDLPTGGLLARSRRSD
jgi:hypothetical protein